MLFWYWSTCHCFLNINLIVKKVIRFSSTLRLLNFKTKKLINAREETNPNVNSVWLRRFRIAKCTALSSTVVPRSWVPLIPALSSVHPHLFAFFSRQATLVSHPELPGTNRTNLVVQAWFGQRGVLSALPLNSTRDNASPF